jgi:uncharacterized protein (TIGR02118 family)
MIRVSVMYPWTEGARFDRDYFLNRHIPMVAEKCGDALQGVTAEGGLGGMQPGEPAPYVHIVDLTFDSLDAFQTAFGPHADEVSADMPNYTSIAPIVQISEVLPIRAVAAG